MAERGRCSVPARLVGQAGAVPARPADVALTRGALLDLSDTAPVEGPNGEARGVVLAATVKTLTRGIPRFPVKVLTVGCVGRSIVGRVALGGATLRRDPLVTSPGPGQPTSCSASDSGSVTGSLHAKRSQT